MFRALRSDWPFFLLLVLQLAFWSQTHQIKPTLEIVPEPPGKLALAALSFGDNELLFRLLALEVENAGDTFGRSTPLKNYNIATLARWFSLLDTLDAKSNLVPSLASYYFSQTQHTEEVKYIVDYLESRYALNPAENWWWLHQAIYLANNVLGDKARALELSYKLQHAPGDVPLWARQSSAFLLAEQGEKEKALAVLEDILSHTGDLSERELDFMRFFIEDRLKALDPTLLQEIEQKEKENQK